MSHARRRSTLAVTVAAAVTAGSLAGAAPAMAAGGTVLAATAAPFGYTLSAAAAATAVYNTGVAASNPATPPPPNIPFQVLVGNATVPTGRYLYLPVFFADNSPPVDPAFPTSVANQAADAAYLDNLVRTDFNVSAFLVQVDGVTTVLNDGYIAGVSTPPLLDGTPAGNAYIVSAAFLSPLSFGAHAVGFGGVINGNPVSFASYTVAAVPEPGTVGATAVAGGALFRRRRPR